MGMTEEARAEAISKAIEAYAESPAQEAIPLPYKDGQEGPFKVIKIPVDAVVFNPKSHRVNAQLDSHPERQLVEQDPFGDEAQAIIRGVLANTDGFDALKANLEEYGQSDAGVVTRKGLLVNANTRLAALRDIDPHGYIKAAVLPSDADETSIDLLELSLQMQRDLKQDYTFPNELWFINDLFTYGYSSEEIAKRLGWAPSNDDKLLKKGVARVAQSTRIWAMIKSIQELSEGAVQLTFFDDKKQILLDLDHKYESMKGSDAAGAKVMKEARIAGMLASSDYRDLRKLDGDTAIEVLVPQLEDAEILGIEVEELVAAPSGSDEDNSDAGNASDDTDLLGGQSEEDLAETTSFAPLVELLAKSAGKDDVQLPSGKTQSRESVVDDLTLVVETTAEEVRTRDKDEKTVRGPIKAMEDSLKQAKAAAARFANVHTEDDFDFGKFAYLAKKLRVQLDAIDEAVEQHEA